MKNQRRTLIAACALCALMVPNTQAGDAGMQKLFDDMGAFGNAGGPGAYRAQGMNIVSGGNLFMRVPQRNYKIAQVALPSLKYGCGGIDLFAGSFSFIGKEQIVSMMKNIGTSAVSYAFKLALDSISPEIHKVLTELQEVAQAMNSTNINSCEAGQAIANGFKTDWQSTKAYYAKVSGPVTGLFDDHSDARDKTQGDGAKAEQVHSAVVDPAMQRKIKPGNVAWRALSELPGLDTKDKQLLMSLSGTVVLTSKIEDAPDYKPPMNITLEQFVRGDDSGKLSVYRCTDGTNPDECLSLGDELIEIKPFAHHVEEKLRAIAKKFKDNEKLTNDEIAFVNVSSLPVYKALAVYTAKPLAEHEALWIARHSDLIAAEYAYYFVIQVSKQMRAAFAQQRLAADAAAQESFDQMLANLSKLREQGERTLHKAYANVQSQDRIVAEIKEAERAIMIGMPSNVAGNLHFSMSGK